MSSSPDFDVFRSPTITWDEQFALVEDLYRRFATLGIPTVASSRLGTYRQVFARFGSVAASERPFTLQIAEEVLATLVESRQLHKIVTAAAQASDPEPWIERLKALISGSPWPQAGEPHSSARDLQFEFFSPRQSR